MRTFVTALFFGLIGFTWWLDHSAPTPTHLEGGAGFTLREVSAERGLDFVHHPPRQLDPRLAHIEPNIAGTGAAVSVADVNADGWPDLYVTNSHFGHANALYLNRGDGSFVDVAAEAGVAELNTPGQGVSMASVWGDIDNDGDADLYVAMWGHGKLFRNDLQDHTAASELPGDAAPGDARPDIVPRFTDITPGTDLDRWMNGNSAVWFDYDRDGLLDLYVGGYFSEVHDLWNLETTEIMQESFEFARNGGRNVLYHNLGDGRFEDVTAAMGAESTRWTYALASADYDDDGWPDLYLANDYGPEECFLNRNGERFELQDDVGLGDDSKSGMAVALGDVQNRGRLAVFVTNISKAGYLFQGNNLRLDLLAEQGRFFNIADGEVADCGWAWGAQFGDLDNDGWQDLFVANGFISASKDADYWYDMSKVSGGTGGIFVDAANWSAMEGRSLSGYERSRVLHNNGGNSFTDVAELVGVDDRYDGRAVALADLENRGALDVLVANQDGPLLLYRNQPDPRHHWISFRLRGTRSNRDAVGARVTLVFPDPEPTAGEQGELTQVRFVTAGQGFSAQNDQRLHFGLGTSERITHVDIRWPSGDEQTLEGLAVDRLHLLTEPPESR